MGANRARLARYAGRLKSAGLLAGLAVLAATPGWANDSSAELATGGLKFVLNGAVRMQSEDLSISLKQVVVNYRFFNTTDRDVSSVVAFPIPDIQSSDDEMVSIPTEDPKNPFNFHTTVNGKAAPMQLEQKAVKSGIDRTALLNAMHVPLAPYLKSTGVALDHLSKAAKATLERLKLVDVEQSQSGGEPMQEHLQPTWTVKSTYYWTQVFPSRQAVLIRHSYQPSVGESAQTELGAPGWRKEADMKSYISDFCPDEALLATIGETMKAKRSPYPTFYEQRIDYVLHTGANWAAPIGHFHLTIDKGSPANLLSVCILGLRKIDETRFELDRSQFKPASDLKILILAPIS